MCVLIVLHKISPEYPLIVAANREEDPKRGGDPPGRFPDGIVAPRDPLAGGTWIGVNTDNVFSAVTNRPGPPASGTQVNSRGTLPLEALKEKSAFLAHRRAERIPTFLFSPFNWIYADLDQAFVLEHGGPSDLTVRLRAGMHVLSNAHDLNRVDLDAILKFLDCDPAKDKLDRIIARLKALLSCHDSILSESHRICKHEGVPQTVSSSIVALHQSDPAKRRWLYHDGPPCRNEWKDVSGLLI